MNAQLKLVDDIRSVNNSELLQLAHINIEMGPINARFHEMPAINRVLQISETKNQEPN